MSETEQVFTWQGGVGGKGTGCGRTLHVLGEAVAFPVTGEAGNKAARQDRKPSGLVGVWGFSYQGASEGVSQEKSLLG